MRFKLLLVVSSAALLGACATTTKSVQMTPVERIADQVTATDSDRAQILSANGNFEAAATLYRIQLKADPDNQELKHKLAESYRLAGKLPEARTMFAELASAEGWQARGLEGLGRVAVAMGDRAGAQQAFESATQADAWSWRSWLALAQIDDLESNWGKADEHYAMALGATKDPATVYNNLGVSMMARGNPAQAADLFRKALAGDPSLIRARTNLDLAEAMAGRTTPTNGSSDPREQARRLNNFAYVAELQNRRDDAMRLYEAAIQQHPSFYAQAFNSLNELKQRPTQSNQGTVADQTSGSNATGLEEPVAIAPAVSDISAGR